MPNEKSLSTIRYRDQSGFKKQNLENSRFFREEDEKVYLYNALLSLKKH
jgi:hypothetical protein